MDLLFPQQMPNSNSKSKRRPLFPLSATSSAPKVIQPQEESSPSMIMTSSLDLQPRTRTTRGNDKNPSASSAASLLMMIPDEALTAIPYRPRPRPRLMSQYQDALDGVEHDDDEDRQISGAAEALTMLSRGEDGPRDSVSTYRSAATGTGTGTGAPMDHSADDSHRCNDDASASYYRIGHGPLKKRRLRPQMDLYTITTNNTASSTANDSSTSVSSEGTSMSFPRECPEYDSSSSTFTADGAPVPVPVPVPVPPPSLLSVPTNRIMPKKKNISMPMLQSEAIHDCTLREKEVMQMHTNSNRHRRNTHTIFCQPVHVPVGIPPFMFHNDARIIRSRNNSMSSSSSLSSSLSSHDPTRTRTLQPPQSMMFSSSSSSSSSIQSSIQSAVSSITTVSATAKRRRKRPSRLAGPDDVRNTNSLHQFVRSDLLELFEVGYDDDDDEGNDNDDDDGTATENRDQSYNTTNANTNANASRCIFKGRVGLRCVHCKHLPKDQRATGAVFYPRNIRGLYRNVCTWQRVHFKSCTHMPESARYKYKMYKENDKTRGRTSYWESSALALGLRDCEGVSGRGGIKFV